MLEAPMTSFNFCAWYMIVLYLCVYLTLGTIQTRTLFTERLEGELGDKPQRFFATLFWPVILVITLIVRGASPKER